jgi:cytidylate kinase
MRIVTISRQVGAYGDVIAAILARKLGLELIGRDQIHILAQSCDPEYNDVCQIYESEHGPGFFERLFLDRPSYTSLFEALTYEQAARDNVIIVGRGSQIILGDFPGVFSVRVVCPVSKRVERIMERFNLNLHEAENFIRRHDSERRSLIKAVFDRDPQDWMLYDLIINTGCYAAAEATDVVATAEEKMEHTAAEDNLQERFTSMALAKRVETMIRKKLTSVVARLVEVNADPGGKVILTGRMRDQKERDKAGRIAADHPGVTSVDNQIKVTDLYFGF